jgi:hypothetical protein
MDRQQAAVHYLSQAEIALRNTLEWCARTYGGPAADKVARLFLDTIGGQNLASYVELSEVLSLWGVISRTSVSPKVFAGEFVIDLNQRFNMFVEPAVIATASSVSADNLLPLGHHIVSTIARCNPVCTLPTTEFHEELANYVEYFKDIPNPGNVLQILTYFPWMAPLYLLGFSEIHTLSALCGAFVIEPGSAHEAGVQ